jgi:hypothetical protein
MKTTNPLADGNALCPRWNHTFSFIVHVPELAMLRVVVSSEDTFGEPVFVAQTCLPVASIVEGTVRTAMGRLLLKRWPTCKRKADVVDIGTLPLRGDWHEALGTFSKTVAVV